MANDDREQWFLPEALRISNPRVAEAAAELQRQLKGKIQSPFGRVSPREFAKNRAAARIQHLSQSLAAVEQQMRQRLGPYETKQLERAHNALSIRLAENLAVAGRPDLAYEVEPRKQYKKQYETDAVNFRSKAKL